jgi:hypothetical protein
MRMASDAAVWSGPLDAVPSGADKGGRQRLGMEYTSLSRTALSTDDLTDVLSLLEHAACLQAG